MDRSNSKKPYKSPYKSRACRDSSIEKVTINPKYMKSSLNDTIPNSGLIFYNYQNT